MTKHDKNFTKADDVDPNLLQRTHTAILAFMAANEGRMPTVQQVHETVKGSFTQLCPAVRLMKERLLATQTRLANMPEIPEDLRLAHEQQLKDMWTRTRELQNGEIMDLRRSQAAKDDNHRRDIEEVQAVIDVVEARCEHETNRADATAAENADMHVKLEVALTALAEANARLAEREAILAMFAARVTVPASDEGEGDIPRSGKSARRASKAEDLETGDLPGINSL